MNLTLQERIQLDLRLEKSPTNKAALKVIVGELQRQPTKILTDQETVGIIKKLIKYEEERLSKYAEVSTSAYLEVLKRYLPAQIGPEEIMIWIDNNIDFPTLKNKMQAVGLVTKHFGPTVNGTLIKEIITTCY